MNGDTVDYLTELLTMGEEDLDEAVHETKAGEAAEINNQGRTAQLAYLTGLSEEEVTKRLQ